MAQARRQLLSEEDRDQSSMLRLDRCWIMGGVGEAAERASTLVSCRRMQVEGGSDMAGPAVTEQESRAVSPSLRDGWTDGGMVRMLGYMIRRRLWFRADFVNFEPHLYYHICRRNKTNELLPVLRSHPAADIETCFPLFVH